MGTSKAYGSPKWPGVNPAVGAAVSSGNPTDQKTKDAVGAFAGAYKNHVMSGRISFDTDDSRRVAIPGPGRGRSRSGGRGVGGAARSRAASSGARLAHFLSTAERSGLGEALRQFDLSELRHRPLEEFLDAVSYRFSGDGGLLDDDALNQVMAETVNELAENVTSMDELDELLTSGNIDIEEVLQVYYANILANNFEQKEYSVVRERISREETRDFFSQARGIIRAIVRDELSRGRDLSTLDWNSPEGQRIADEINQEIMEILIPHE